MSYAAVRKYLQSKNEESFQAAINKYKDRTEKDLGIRNAVDPRLTEGKAALIRQEEERTDIIDMTGVCGWLTGFTGLPVDARTIAQFLTLGFGRTVSLDELKQAATRLHHTERAFLGMCGLTRHDDRLSKAHYGRVKPGGKEMMELNCTDEELEQMKNDYYSLMEWSLETGLPTRQTLEKYNLLDIPKIRDWFYAR
jgi:aldehyde:ferredoxin oxidoreductase